MLRKVYKDPESAFAACNPRGGSAITVNDFLNNIIIKQSGYDP